MILHRPRIAGSPSCRALALLALASIAGCAGPSDRLNRPNGVAVEADGNLLVVDKNNYRIVRLDDGGKVIDAFGGLGNSQTNLPAPYDIALGPGGAIYVCDRTYATDGSYKDHDGVKVFTPEGRFLREIGGQDYEAGEANNGPYGLDVDSQGNVWIADYHKNRVREYDASGDLVQVFGELGSGPGQMSGPNDVVVDEHRGVVYVIESINARVQKFTLQGKPLMTFGHYGRDDDSFSYPQYLDLDPDGTLYVSDMGNRRVKKYSPDGTFLASLAPPDDGTDRQLMGLTVRRVSSGRGRYRQEILVADTLNNRILVFDEDAGLRATLG